MSDLSIVVVESSEAASIVDLTLDEPRARLPFEAEHAQVLHLLLAARPGQAPVEDLRERARACIADVETLSISNATTSAATIRFRVKLTQAGRAEVPLARGQSFGAALVETPLDAAGASDDEDILASDSGTLSQWGAMLDRDVFELDALFQRLGQAEAAARAWAPAIERRFAHGPHTAALVLGRLGAPRSSSALVLALGENWNTPDRAMPRPAALTALGWLGDVAQPLASGALDALSPTTDYERLALPFARWRVLGDRPARDAWLAALARVPRYASPFAKTMVFDAPSALAADLADVAAPALEAAGIDTAFERRVLRARQL